MHPLPDSIIRADESHAPKAPGPRHSTLYIAGLRAESSTPVRLWRWKAIHKVAYSGLMAWPEQESRPLHKLLPITSTRRPSLVHHFSAREMTQTVAMSVCYSPRSLTSCHCSTPPLRST